MLTEAQVGACILLAGCFGAAVFLGLVVGYAVRGSFCPPVQTNRSAVEDYVRIARETHAWYLGLQSPEIGDRMIRTHLANERLMQPIPPVVEDPQPDFVLPAVDVLGSSPGMRVR